jgi:hypothetical protein
MGCGFSSLIDSSNRKSTGAVTAGQQGMPMGGAIGGRLGGPGLIPGGSGGGIAPAVIAGVEPAPTAGSSDLYASTRCRPPGVGPPERK